MKDMKLFFAPMQGYTDAAYRNIHEQIFGGIEAYYTPFVRLEKGQSFRPRELRDVDKENNSVKKLIPQVIASTPEELDILVEMLQGKGYSDIDINIGCPFPLLVRRHKGAGLLPYPDEVNTLLSATEKYPSVHFSVKMRLGWEHLEDCLALLPILNKYSLQRIVLHARLGIQQYKGKVDEEAFALFYADCKHPLVYNGDVSTLEDICRIEKRFPTLEGVMIGRGLLADPSLALAYKTGMKLGNEEYLERVAQMHKQLLDYYTVHLNGGDSQLLVKMKTFWEYLFPEMERKWRKQILKSNKQSSYLGAVQNAIAQMRQSYQ